MRSFTRITTTFLVLLTTCAQAAQVALTGAEGAAKSYDGRNVSSKLFNELEELSRIVDITYCVGVTGIRRPFDCAGRCGEFPGWELVDTWNTGLLMSDSCGYIALDHTQERVIVAFRGTYSIANTIVDLSTVPQEYVPFPGNPADPEDGRNDDDGKGGSWWDRLRNPFGGRDDADHDSMTAIESRNPKISGKPEHKCNNCTVHSGFFTSWQHTRQYVLPHVSHQHAAHPTYKIHLVGHSLGGAVAALAGIEFELLGWQPTITTFGEPRIGNLGLRNWMDDLFLMGDEGPDGGRYRRVTHADDPVPLLPLAEWGFVMHGGEIYISKPSLSPMLLDLEICAGDEDPQCIAGEDEPAVVKRRNLSGAAAASDTVDLNEADRVQAEMWGLPPRYKMWQLFFAHRDYFWRLGLCVPGGDPYDWGRDKYGKGKVEGDDMLQDASVEL